MVSHLPPYFLSFTLWLLTYTSQGHQCAAVVKGRYLAIKAKLEELTKDNEDLLKKISKMMNKLSKAQKLCSKAKENTKAIIERKEALEKELHEVKKTLEDKTMELGAFVAANNEKIQAAYY
ncbi:hypothetical protein SO802_017841 [Lithocarpus litseifolius]|uniref:Uncharacterized protein n=1 Tax=Lithocarpus litseifolius TaxID=425828 RepID=A0AAW2CL66_9ROSI